MALRFEPINIASHRHSEHHISPVMTRRANLICHISLEIHFIFIYYITRDIVHFQNFEWVAYKITPLTGQ